MTFNSLALHSLAVDRAISDQRRGVPVILYDQATASALLVSPTETTDKAVFNSFFSNNAQASLLISKPRARYLFQTPHINTPLCFPIHPFSLEKIQEFVHAYPVEKFELTLANGREANQLEQSALQLAKYAELFPGCLICPLPFNNVASFGKELLTVSKQMIDEYQLLIAKELKEASRATLYLKHISQKVELISFRPIMGDKEHYALIIGEPDPLSPPLVRIHSSCYTGDLLASLRCDCRDQLHLAIQQIAAQKNGGIILYLMQEGRGIGLANKLRTYQLQSLGLDTVDANHYLGFDDDERLFLPASSMLKALNIRKVELLSNNPRKAKGLEEEGIIVTQCHPLLTTSNLHNEDYLKTKSTRLGHKINHFSS